MAGRICGIALCFLFAGCLPLQLRTKPAEEVEKENDLSTKIIGEVTEVANMQPIQVSGFGLVTGLDGTGHSPPGTWRTLLEQQLRKQRVENVKQLLDSPNNALVLVTAFIRPGSRKGEPLDVEVTLPPQSKASSLRGGYLQECVLRNHDSTRNLSPEYSGSDRLLQGHILGRAKGPLLVGIGNPDEPAELRKARIWGGGISFIERPIFLELKKDDRSTRIANAIAGRINLMFQDDPRRQQIVQQNQRLLLLDDVTQQLNQKMEQNFSGSEMARAVNREIVQIRVPIAYRLNTERYLRVARLAPLREAPEDQPKYRRRLQKMLLDPAETVRAALRLEALGKESMPALKAGLQHEHPLVRFTSAEALTYLGSAAGVDELARLTEQHQPLRLFGLMALAGLDESVCRQKLGEMLASEDVELRSGAFRALRLMDEFDVRLGGELLNQAFWLHKVAPGSAKLVHFAMGKRAEVVLFGDDITVSPVKVLAGPEFTVTIDTGDDRCTVSRISAHSGVARKQCSTRLEEVIRTMAELGASYPEVVDLLRKLSDEQALDCPVAINSLPQEISVEALQEGGRNPDFLR
ncbi:MAG: flagellar basal body P-ring protein FlgI [Gemmataceae bacterium]|nr:flagellar basal body P-ring protein FlgI [Gemmataceae bacterium]